MFLERSQPAKTDTGSTGGVVDRADVNVSSKPARHETWGHEVRRGLAAILLGAAAMVGSIFSGEPHLMAASAGVMFAGVLHVGEGFHRFVSRGVLYESQGDFAAGMQAARVPAAVGFVAGVGAMVAAYTGNTLSAAFAAGMAGAEVAVRFVP